MTKCCSQQLIRIIISCQFRIYCLEFHSYKVLRSNRCVRQEKAEVILINSSNIYFKSDWISWATKLGCFISIASNHLEYISGCKNQSKALWSSLFEHPLMFRTNQFAETLTSEHEIYNWTWHLNSSGWFQEKTNFHTDNWQCFSLFKIWVWECGKIAFLNKRK